MQKAGSREKLQAAEHRAAGLLTEVVLPQTKMEPRKCGVSSYHMLAAAANMQHLKERASV